MPPPNIRTAVRVLQDLCSPCRVPRVRPCTMRLLVRLRVRVLCGLCVLVAVHLGRDLMLRHRCELPVRHAPAEWEWEMTGRNTATVIRLVLMGCLVLAIVMLHLALMLKTW